LTSVKNIVVANTSPIIYLSAINRTDLLKRLFHEIFIPGAVRQEIISGGKDTFGFREIENEQWIKPKNIENELAKKCLLTDIDDGEAEVIVLAEELKANIIVMDDRLGRKVARLRGFHVIGTLRLLMAAKERGIIAEVKPLVERLKEVGFWISDDVYKDILARSSEAL